MSGVFDREELTAEQRADFRAEAWRAFKAQFLMYVWNDETLRAEAFLDEAPAVLVGSAEVAELRRMTDEKLRHAHDWDAYVDRYDSLPPVVYDPYAYDRAERLSVGRVQAVYAWAESVPTDGPPIEIMSVGPQDCTIERDLLRTNPRFRMTMTEVCRHASTAMEETRLAWPDRVAVHVPQDYYDWPMGPFDVILFLEIIEHLPSQEVTLAELRRRLAPGGVVLLSTPVCGYWANDILHDRPWWMHLHCNSPESLMRKFEAAGFEGKLGKLEDGQYFWAELWVKP